MWQLEVSQFTKGVMTAREKGKLEHRVLHRVNTARRTQRVDEGEAK